MIQMEAIYTDILALNELKMNYLTTNKKIVNYDFFNPNNICVVDRESLYVPSDFLEREYTPIRDDVLVKYSSTNWVKEFIAQI